MNTRFNDDNDSPDSGSRLRLEMIVGSAWLAFGLFVVPAVIYWVGTATLGPYGENAGLSTFYGAFFADLASGAPRAWLLALGPLLLMSLIRLLYIGVGTRATATKTDDDDEPAQKPKPKPVAKRTRVEPRVG
ncbi:MAG: hypothetical protein ABW106_06445 [Steroidobacteraceae bacterium]